ncbi:hypothetical protein [Chlorobium phaeobacteroides]|jgi:hypothetical protein
MGEFPAPLSVPPPQVIHPLCHLRQTCNKTCAFFLIEGSPILQSPHHPAGKSTKTGTELVRMRSSRAVPVGKYFFIFLFEKTTSYQSSGSSLIAQEKKRIHDSTAKTKNATTSRIAETYNRAFGLIDTKITIFCHFPQTEVFDTAQDFLFPTKPSENFLCST